MFRQRDLLLLSFPFSELKTTKVRPVVVISSNKYNGKFDDMIVVPVTSNLEQRGYSILIANKDLEEGKLIKESKIKVDRILSVSKSLVKMRIGKVGKHIHCSIRKILIELIEDNK